MSNTVGYSLGACTAGVKYNLTQGEDATGNTVGYALGGCSGCWNDDYRDRRYWAQIPVSATVTSGTDYYGALAPTLKFQGGGTYREICPNVCFCEGPVAEGVTVTKYLDRYETRWMALLVEGLIYYGRVDGALIQVPLDLFPDPLPDTATHIALSFDANARPVFAYEDGGTIYIHRYVADVPTIYSWTGTNPCLFFNGVINYDDSLTDVVCYHLTASGGSLYARFQRENFGVANLVLEDPGLDSLMAVDRGRGALASHMVIELSGKRVFAAVYPPWPILAVDFSTASVGLLADGECRELVVVSGPYFDGGTASLELGSDGSCDSCILIVSTEEPFAEATLALSSNGSCDQLVIVSGPYFDAASASLGLTSNGVCDEIVISGGSYTEAVASALVINSDGDCSTI
ncbi:MAG: hypothetical protein BWY06_03007 [Candidatus Latescibacteria bacterium ADurb.Bin168]|nr:MAG: hypothetical protein BWY06_03007 [Candidatus Latescibacteria bacterium ADurb.Bin168]